MKKFQITWENYSSNGMFPLSHEFNSITDTFDCLRAMLQNAKNVSFNEDDLLYQLGLLFNGDLDGFGGDGFSVKAVGVR